MGNDTIASKFIDFFGNMYNQNLEKTKISIENYIIFSYNMLCRACVYSFGKQWLHIKIYGSWWKIEI